MSCTERWVVRCFLPSVAVIIGASLRAAKWETGKKVGGSRQLKPSWRVWRRHCMRAQQRNSTKNTWKASSCIENLIQLSIAHKPLPQPPTGGTQALCGTFTFGYSVHFFYSFQSFPECPEKLAWPIWGILIFQQYSLNLQCRVLGKSGDSPTSFIEPMHLRSYRKRDWELGSCVFTGLDWYSI